MQRQHIVPILIEDEVKQSYLDYSMSVIVSRALPDVRDGLKPSQRRILMAMHDLNLEPARKHRKCAKIAGDTSGNYHPHGEMVIYPTLARMAQDFNLRYMLVDGQGNFGSIDGDPPGAMRYTEARMAHPAVELLADLEKETVDFAPNYDDTRKEPVVLPGKFPNLICNGCSGIAVGMATNIPPHNLSEVVDALLALIEDPELDADGLMRHISGPDFPTGGIIYGVEGVRAAYRTGRGRVVIRARATIETLKNGREHIVITEIPFMVTKSSLIENIAALVRQKKIEGISDLRDESDRDGLRIVIELKRDAYASVILNQLYTRTRLQNSFGVNMLALVDGQPMTLTLKQVLAHYVEHRHRVVVRRTQFELDKAQKRAHIVEGLRIALDHIDEVIALIRKAEDRPAARAGLMEEFRLSEVQADAILEMRLQRLTGLERKKVEDEYLELIKEITRLEGILMSKPQRMAIIRAELEELRKKYGDDRRTKIVASAEEFSIEDLIAEENMVITISHTGYIKRTPITTYRRQRRGGRGGKGMSTGDEDFVEHLFIASTHSYILFLTDGGHCYWLKVHEIPEGGRMARGRSVANLLAMDREASIAAIVPVKEFDEDHFLLMATQHGLVKKTVLSAYGRPRRDGIIAMDIVPGDRLIEAKLTDGSQDVILATRRGQSIRFRESDVRATGRATRGVTGVSLRDGDEVVSMVVVKRQGSLIMVCRNGYGKRTPVQDYPVIRRGGKGVIGIKTTDRNGALIAAKEVVDSDELMIISQKGILIRLPLRDVSVIGRNTQGVRLIHLDPEDVVMDVTYIMTDGAEEKELEEEGGELPEEGPEVVEEADVDEEGEVVSGDSDEDGDKSDEGIVLDLFATGSSDEED
ncbi:MAG: DNA gyrase subunit A [Candidatus Latescibacteria bacterium]|nr:DNA gyrase subunit A [Candidatus Latescibacterota bacterium]